ncbi:MAG: hypothetical protein M1822_003420 [Bathelium mastoideum]|nr:MAG: hypothetical protein M1822_003420 [Bathelium mastoideum]
MLAIKTAPDGASKCTPNLLPCRINHNGQINAKKRYWNPETDSDGKPKVYFRGRAILTKTNKLMPTQQAHMPALDLDELEPDEEEDAPEDVKIADVSRTFDNFIVWEHDSLPDPAGDPHIKGIEEWIQFAEKMHGHPLPTKPANEEYRGS